jgi:branched-chain amino acid transport system substrate-binding protein
MTAQKPWPSTMGRQAKRLVAGLATTVLAACGGGGGSTPTAAAGSLACTNGHILIGLDKGVSGASAFFDTAGLQGTQIAIDEQNAAGGIHGCQIATVAGDAQSNPAVGGQVAQSLIKSGVQSLVVPDDFDLGIAAAQAGEKAGLLTLSAAASSTQFGKAVGPHFFNGGIPTGVLGSDAARFALDHNWKKAYFVENQSLVYFTEQDTAYKAVSGTNVIGTDVNNSFTAADFSSTVTKIAAAKPDVIYNLLTFPPAGTFVKQLRAAGINTPVLGDVTLDTGDLLPLVPVSGLKNVYFVTIAYWVAAGVDSSTDPALVKFAQEFQAKFGKFPEQTNAPTAYLFFKAIFSALNQPGVTDADSAAKAINAETDLQLPGGILHGWRNGYAVWNGVVVGFTPSGAFTKVTEYPSQ